MSIKTSNVIQKVTPEGSNVYKKTIPLKLLQKCHTNRRFNRPYGTIHHSPKNRPYGTHLTSPITHHQKPSTYPPIHFYKLYKPAKGRQALQTL